MREDWRNIDGFPDYQVSSLGRVRSFKGLNPLFLKQSVHKKTKDSKTEYLRVRIRDDMGVEKNKRVHRLVLEAFVGCAPSEKHQAAHIDGNSRNNWLANLKWATQEENENDKELHGTKLWGSDVTGAKLNPAAVRRIRRVKKWSSSLKLKMARDLGVSHRTINDVLSGRTWSWLK
jgi:hypothetical protein